MLSGPKQGYSMINHPALPAVFVECEHEALVVYTGDAGLVAVFGREQLGADVSRQAVRLGLLGAVVPHDVHHHLTYNKQHVFENDIL